MPSRAPRCAILVAALRFPFRLGTGQRSMLLVGTKRARHGLLPLAHGARGTSPVHDACVRAQGAEPVPPRSTKPSSPPGSTRLATAAKTSELRIQWRRPVMKSTTPLIETT